MQPLIFTSTCSFRFTSHNHAWRRRYTGASSRSNHQTSSHWPTCSRNNNWSFIHVQQSKQSNLRMQSCIRVRSQIRPLISLNRIWMIINTRNASKTQAKSLEKAQSLSISEFIQDAWSFTFLYVSFQQRTDQRICRQSNTCVKRQHWYLHPLA